MKGEGRGSGSVVVVCSVAPSYNGSARWAGLGSIQFRNAQDWTAFSYEPEARYSYWLLWSHLGEVTCTLTPRPDLQGDPSQPFVEVRNLEILLYVLENPTLVIP